MKELLEQMKVYVEAAEEFYDGEYGSGHSFKELLEKGMMPDLYHKVITEIAKVDGGWKSGI